MDVGRGHLSVVEAFVSRMGSVPEALVHAPGRVNLIGEHTDYNEGWVLPVALDMGTELAAGRRPDPILHTLALRLGAEDEVRLDDLRPAEGPHWTRYVRGVAALLPDLGVEPPGSDVVIGGDLPLQSGLASSASLEMAVALALVRLAGREVDAGDLARLGQRVENEIVGVRSGIMDQLVIAHGEEGSALLIDCRTLRVEPVPIPERLRVLVLDSAVPRSLAASAYNRRWSESAAALEAIRAGDPSIGSLRDVTLELLESEQHRLSPLELRRARHVVTENQRVHQAVMALRRGDDDEVGRLMLASHESLRDDYQVSAPELDWLVTTALATPGVVGARLTGAGFGGCVVALVEAERVESAAASIVDRYRRATGRDGRSYVCIPSRGASVSVP